MYTRQIIYITIYSYENICNTSTMKCIILDSTHIRYIPSKQTISYNKMKKDVGRIQKCQYNKNILYIHVEIIMYIDDGLKCI